MSKAVSVTVWGVFIVLLLIGLLVPSVRNSMPEGMAASGWLSGGLFSAGVLSAGLFSAGVFSAGLFSVGIFSAGVFSLGVFSAGTFVAGIWVVSHVCKGLRKKEPNGKMEGVQK